MKEYQVEVEVYKGKQAICIFPTLQARTEKEAKVKAKEYANNMGFFGTMKMKVFGGNPVQDHSGLVF